MIFNHLKRGNVRKKVCSPYIKTKEVNFARRAKKTAPKKQTSLFYLCRLFSLLRKGAKASPLPCLAMREKIEIMRNLAEAMLDELAEMEALLIEKTALSENVDCGFVDS